MLTDPITGAPLAAVKEEQKKRNDQRLSSDGFHLEKELSGEAGQRHIQDMVKDYEDAVNSINPGLSNDALRQLVGRMNYIQSRLAKWNMTINLGRKASENIAMQSLNT